MAVDALYNVATIHYSFSCLSKTIEEAVLLNTSVCSIKYFNRALYINVRSEQFSFLKTGLDNRGFSVLCTN